jgi:glycosyltransferase involved in cell wall biosynthesis
MGGELVDIPDIHYGGRAVWTGRALTTLALRATTTLTAGCSNVVELARGFLPPCSHPKVAMLPWGIDQHALASGSQQVQLEGSFRILHVGSLIPVKDQHTLLQAIARLRSTEPGVHLHVVGQGPLRSSLEKLAARLGLVDAVTFHGHVVRHELPAFYRAADVFALSSRHEAQSVVVLEAGLNGLPIVGTSVGLVADFAPHAAVAVPVGDDAALANALTDLRQPAIRRRLGTAVRDLICSEYLASHTVDRLLSLYDRLE